MILDGKDKNYIKAAQLGRLFIPLGEKGIPLRHRVSRHLAALRALVASLEELRSELCIELKNIPSSATLQKAGIGAFLKGQK